MISLRPSGFDELGLRWALSDRILPAVVAAMAFLAALALAGWFATAALSRHLQDGPGTSMTVQVPQAGEPVGTSTETRLHAVLTVLQGTPGVASAQVLSDQQLRDLLQPWLGQAEDHLALPIPAVIAVRLAQRKPALDALTRRLTQVAQGVLVEDHSLWMSRLATLARSLQACAALTLLLVAAVAAAVIAVTTRAGLATRREAIEIVHGLGATDQYIAARFAGRATTLAAIGATVGALLALPVLITLSWIAAPFSSASGRAGDALHDALVTVPAAAWLMLVGLPLGAAAIGFATAQIAVRQWLRRLP